jgi:hypothetical protein
MKGIIPAANQNGSCLVPHLCFEPLRESLTELCAVADVQLPNGRPRLNRYDNDYHRQFNPTILPHPGCAIAMNAKTLVQIPFGAHGRTTHGDNAFCTNTCGIPLPSA